METVQVQPAEELEPGIPLEVRLETRDVALLEKYVQLEKIKAVNYKRAGDKYGASEALSAYKQLQARLDEVKSGQSDANLAQEYKAKALECKRAGDLEAAREWLAKAVHLEKGASPQPDHERAAIEAKARAALKAKAKLTLEKLVAQSEAALDAAKTYLKEGSKEDSSKFLARKKAFDADMLSIKQAVSTGKQIPASRTVSLQVPVDLEVEGVAEDELSVSMNALKSSGRDVVKSKSKSFFESKSDHFIRVVFEWPPDADPATHRKSIGPFKMSSPLNNASVSFFGIKRDLKGHKFFDHHKLRIELYKKESGFFSSSNVLLGTVLIRLNCLLMQPSYEQSCAEFLDGNRRSLGFGVDVSLKLKKPISTKISNMKAVQWTVFDSLQSGRLFPGCTTPAPSPVTEEAAEITEATSEIQEIESYAVLEYELEQLGLNPQVSIDPQLVAKQLALESKRDAIGLKIQLGQLSFEDYVASLQASIAQSKRKALEAKRSGNIDQARHHMKHVQIMENEIAEATEE